MEGLNKIVNAAKKEMELALEHLEKAFSYIRAGKASPLMLEAVKVEYYGAMTPLSQVANLSAVDAMTLSIQPYERSMLAVIDKAIINSNLGFTPTNNGENLQIRLPMLTEEGRKDLVKRSKLEAETAKVSMRNIRRNANHLAKKVEDVSEDLIEGAKNRIQKLTDDSIEQVDKHFSLKEKEILTV